MDFFFHDAEGNATSRFKCWIYSINFHSELESYKIVNVCLNTPTFKHLFTISSDHWYSKINFDHKKEKKKHLVNLLYLKEKNETIYFSIFISTDGSTIVTQEDIILPTWRNRSSLLGLLLFPESFLLIKTTSKVSNCKYMCKAMPSKKIEFGILISPNFVRAQVLANRMAWTCFVSDHTTKNFFFQVIQ